MQLPFFIKISVVALLVLVAGGAHAAATLGERVVGTACPGGNSAADFDTLAQCSATASAGVFQKAPIIIGQVTTPPYGTVTCDSTKAGMMQFTGTSFQGCNGTSWQQMDGSVSCPTGYISVPRTKLPSGTVVPAFCVMRYEAQDGGKGIATSTEGGTPLVSITWQQAAGSCAAAGAQLITENQWLSIAHQVTTVASNWSGAVVGTGYLYSGHNDNSPANALAAPSSATADGYTGTGNTSPSNQRRTLTLPNGEILWDFAGNVWEWVAQTIPIASRYGGGAAQWMAYHSNDGVAPISDSLMPLDKLPQNSWNANQGMGRYYDGASTAGAYNTVSEWPDNAGTAYVAPTAAFLRGGSWGDAAGAGVFTLHFGSGRSYVGSGIGFRCTR